MAVCQHTRTVKWVVPLWYPFKMHLKTHATLWFIALSWQMSQSYNNPIPRFHLNASKHPVGDLWMFMAPSQISKKPGDLMGGSFTTHFSKERKLVPRSDNVLESHHCWAPTHPKKQCQVLPKPCVEALQGYFKPSPSES